MLASWFCQTPLSTSLLGITLEVLTMIELNTSLNEKGCVTIAPE